MFDKQNYYDPRFFYTKPDGGKSLSSYLRWIKHLGFESRTINDPSPYGVWVYVKKKENVVINPYSGQAKR